MRWIGMLSPGRFLGSLIVLSVILGGGVATQAALPAFKIVIESTSPYYEPATARVTAGIPIVWENPTPSHHTVTFDGCVSRNPCPFDSGALGPDQKFTVPGLPAGHYPYHCRLHPIMRGNLIVGDPASTSSQT